MGGSESNLIAEGVISVRTHHATRTFRLSCGCIRDYSGMTAGKSQEVLCVACRKPAKTLYAYPENTCAVEGWASSPGMHVFCTKSPGTKSCADGFHYDEITVMSFEEPGKVRAGHHGNTRRA